MLFADISGFTPLAEELDPEALTTLLREYFGELSAEVRSRDGWLAKFIGDAILAVFGAPTAHEDDPVRAVRVALAMQARMRSLNRRLAGRLIQPLHLHIGINTGLVVAGPSIEVYDGPPDPSHFTVLGDAVNVAARLQQVAVSEQILVGETTYQATQWAFDYRALPPLTLKGKREPLQAYHCLGPRRQPLLARGLEGIQAPMLGRDAELERLLHTFTLAQQGRPQVVSLVGEAGLGKSRLLREFLAQIETELAPEQCWRAFGSDDRPEPYGVARQLFEPVLQRAPNDPTAAQLWKLLGPGMDADDEMFRYLDPEQRQQRLYLVAREFMATHARERPLLLLVEDLHWADASSVELLRFLAMRPGPLRLLIVLTHRPTMASVATWKRQAELHAISIPPLPDEILRQVLGAYFGASVASFPPAMVEMLLQRAEGNPFYLEELVRSLIQQGVLVHEDGWQVTRPVEQLMVPRSLQGLLLARLDALESDARLLLQEVSVLGQTFGGRLLEAYTTLGRDLADPLHELAERNLLRSHSEHGDPTYHFQHTLVREVAYESLLVRTRRTLHRRAAEAIESLHPTRLEEHLLDLADHYYHACDEIKGVAYLERAGERAQRVYANAEAAISYRRALELIPVTRRLERSHLWRKLGDVYGAQGLFEQAIAEWQRALRCYEEIQQTTEVVALHRRIASALWAQGCVDEAERHLQAGLTWVGREPATPEVAALYQEFAIQALHRGDSAAMRWAERALALSQETAAYEQASLAATTRGVALARGGAVERGLESVEEGLRIAREHTLPLAAGRAVANLAVLYANIDPLRAVELCEWGLAEARRIGAVAIQPWFYATLAGSLHACANDYETATRSVELAIEIDRQLGLRSHLPVPLIVLGQIHQCHSQWAEAETCYREALSIAEELADPQLLFPALEGLGTLALEQGDSEGGTAWLSRARHVCEAAGFTMQEMVLLPFFL